MSAALLAQRKQEVIAKVKACIETGNRLFNVTLPNIDIRFDLKGRAAGMACRRGSHYYLRFNTDMMLRDAWEHVINDTVPHEVSHSFCQFNPRLGSGHDAGWARVCRALGGNAERCHSEEVVYGKGTTYEYTTDRGHKVRVGDRHHNYLQTRGSLTWKHGKGTVALKAAYSIVGMQGRSLATPVAKVPTAPVAPVQAITPAVTAARTSYTIGAPEQRNVATAIPQGTSKAAMSRAIMLSGYNRKLTYEQIIAAMIAACGYERQLARATFKANAPKVGIPENFA